ncbi:MAG: DUF938 domain-containing protein [Marivibrio sp.]|uniref:DUF938 domain-containing protein n=1 Tax=Marivibrio sp. TaxID=2039719 RepID=UPI0032EFFF41
MSDPRRHAPATLRNRDALLPVLQAHLPASGRRGGQVLEIASGTGEHAAFFAPRLAPELRWRPSDAEPEALASIDAHAAASEAPEKIAPAIALDVTADAWPAEATEGTTAIFCANMIHIAPWAAAEGLLRGAGRLLPAGAPLLLYGPFKRDGRHTAESNEAFDESLRARDPSWGVRDLESEVLPLADARGLTLKAIEAMPANNLTVIFRKG